MKSLEDNTSPRFGFFDHYLFQLRDGVARQHLINLSRQTKNNSYVSLFLIASIFVLLYPHAPKQWLFLWASLHASIFIFMLYRITRPKIKAKHFNKPDLTKTRKGLYHAMGWAFVSAAFWSSLTVFIPNTPTFVQFGLILLMGGMAAGASTTLASITLVSSVFIITCNLPVILYFALTGGFENLAIAIMLATFTTAMLITTRIVNRSLTQQLSAEVKNEKYRKANFQDKIIAIINNENDSDKALQFCLEEICSRMGWPVGHVYWVSDNEDKKIQSSSVWHISNMKLFKPFKRVTENTDINQKTGFLSRVLTRRSPIWIENLETDKGFIRRSVAKATGIKSAFAFPIFINNKTVAILEFYNTEVSPIDHEFVELIEPIGIQIGRAIERHSNNQSLKESEARFRALIKNSGQGIIVHEHGKPLFVNEEIERIFGFSIKQFLKMSSIYSLVIPEDQKKLRDYDDDIYKNIEDHEGVEYTALDNKGNNVPLMMRSSVISWLGNDAILSTIVDLTALKKAELKLQQKQKMEAVGKLTGGIAHDFNNILMAISGNLELLKSKVEGDKTLSRWVEIALHGADRGSDLTKQLLLFSKQREMRAHNIIIHDAIHSLSLLTSNTLPSNITCSFNVPQELPKICVDPSEFDSAIINLIVNSRDAMPNGGSLKIDAKAVTVDKKSPLIDEIKPGKYIALSVSDTGTGIPKAIEKQIFDPFFSNKEHGKGFGLGLSSVLGFVQSSGGTITLETELNKGTCFTLYFPEAPDEEQGFIDDLANSNNEIEAHGELILVVEDDPSIRAVVMDFLQIKGFKTIGAVDGDNALEIINKTDDIALVISDIMMPGSINGIELVTKYIGDDPTRKAVLMTGYSGDQMISSSKVPDNVIVLRKPFQRELFFKTIQKTLNQSK